MEVFKQPLQKLSNENNDTKFLMKFDSVFSKQGIEYRKANEFFHLACDLIDERKNDRLVVTSIVQVFQKMELDDIFGDVSISQNGETGPGPLFHSVSQVIQCFARSQSEFCLMGLAYFFSRCIERVKIDGIDNSQGSELMHRISDALRCNCNFPSLEPEMLNGLIARVIKKGIYRSF